jgi:hypothetical protein
MRTKTKIGAFTGQIKATRTLYYRSASGKKVAQNKRTILGIFRAIEKYFPNLETNSTEKVVLPNGITIERDRTGPHPGQNHQGTFKVTTGKHIFFIKVNRQRAELIAKRITRILDRLRQLKFKFNDYNIRPIRTYLLYQKGSGPRETIHGKTFTVTEYFDKHRETPLSTLPYFEVSQLRRTIDTLNMDLIRNADDHSRRFIFDTFTLLGKEEPNAINFFYEKPTKTIWLFDF